MQGISQHLNELEVQTYVNKNKEKTNKATHITPTYEERHIEPKKYNPANQTMQPQNPELLTPEQMAALDYTLLPFNNEWQQMLGNPAHNFKLMVHGEPGHGKTVLLLRFAKYLADNFGNVLYISSEEYGTPTLSEKVKRFNIYSNGLMFGKSVNVNNIGQYSFVFIDSINHAKLKLDDFVKLINQYPNTAFIIIAQHNKDGSFRGGKDWEHEVDIAAEVQNREFKAYKNRFI